MNPLKLAVFASGRGSNFLAILEAARAGRLSAEVKVVISNNPEAGALVTARENNIPAIVVSKKDYTDRTAFVRAMLTPLSEHRVEMVILAGYMKKIPPEVVDAFEHRILNIHPALLPSFGGQGMYGHHVHEAVLVQGCRVTGVTVHLVDRDYDRGPIVAQRCVPVEEGDTPDTLAARVLKVEHQIFSESIQLFAEGRVTVTGGRVRIRP
ncbi:phosphoribosylglycinamide formyltransferase [bacterium]|nr:phosphoribosylglycinamide formyltransferase [bacterium]